MNDEPLVIASAANEKYATGLGVMMCSALLCSKQKTVVFHILDDGILPKTKTQLRDSASRVARLSGTVVEVNFIDFGRLSLPALSPLHGSLTTYGRIFLPDLLEEESVFYVDADIICNREFPLHKESALQYPDALLVGCIDPVAELAKDCPWKDELSEGEYTLPNINCGFMWMNLKALREFGLQEKFRTLAEKGTHMRCGDQTALNFLCRGRIGLIDPNFNHFWNNRVGIKPENHCCNIHFVGKSKPWCGKATIKLLLYIKHFNLAARYFGFTQNKVPKTLEIRLIASCWTLYLKLTFYWLTCSNRIEKTRRLMNKRRRVVAYTRSYEAKLDALFGSFSEERRLQI